MNHYTADDWLSILKAITNIIAAIGVVVGIWKGRALPGQVAAIHHETVIKPRVAAVKAALSAAAQERNS